LIAVKLLGCYRFSMNKRAGLKLSESSKGRGMKSRRHQVFLEAEVTGREGKGGESMRVVDQGHNGVASLNALTDI
jgi:hypothetical protein